MKTILLSAALLLFASGNIQAQSSITAETAAKMIEGCIAHAKSKQQSHAIAILDAGGHPIATMRMDGNSPGVGEFALQKARAVAHWQFSTTQMENSAKATPGFANAPFVVTVGGGVPVFSGRQFVGAVGVSGEAAKDDEACAEAAIKAGGFFPTRRSQ